MKTYGYFGIRKEDHKIVSNCKTDETLFFVCGSLCAQTIKKNCKEVNRESVNLLGKTYAEDPGWSRKVWIIKRKYKYITY